MRILNSQIAWKVWLNIGTESTKPPTAGLSGDKNDVDIFIPSQAYLTALTAIFPALFQHIKHRCVDLLRARLRKNLYL